VVYRNGTVLTEDRQSDVWWDDIEWKAVQQLNVMGVIIPAPFQSISFRREAIATSGSSGEPVAIICSIHYKEIILTFKFMLITE
jgi:hypothetical protein